MRHTADTRTHTPTPTHPRTHAHTPFGCPGPESIVIRLRGVVVSRDEDPIRRQALEKKLHAKLTQANMHSFFTQLLNTQKVCAAPTSTCGVGPVSRRVVPPPPPPDACFEQDRSLASSEKKSCTPQPVASGRVCTWQYPAAG